MKLLCIAAAVLTAVNLSAQSNDALDVIKKSYAAHGGVHGTDSLKVAFKFSSKTRINEGQSFVTEAPFESYISDDEYFIDKAAKRSAYKTKGNLAGGFWEEHVISFDNGHGFDVNTLRQSYFEITNLPNPRMLQQNFLLKSALADPSKLKYIDAYHVKFDTIDIYINKNTFLVDRITRGLFEPHSSKGTLTISWENYVKAGKIMVPQKYITEKTNLVYGTIKNTFDLTDIRTSFDIAPELFVVPQGFTTSPPGTKDCELSKLSDGLYFLESIEGKGGAYHVLVAEFADYLLITEAPLDIATSRRVIQKLKESFPTKPVRYLVQSHSHYDHMGGILGYTEAGVTIIASKDAAGVINRMAKAFEKSSGRSWKKPSIQIVKDKLTISDATNSCTAYNVGPNPHSRELLVSYFPKQKALYQADVFEPGRNDFAANTDFIKKIKALKLNIETVVPAHGDIARGEEIAQLVR